jgi:GT2 family glycosyltransferase
MTLSVIILSYRNPAYLRLALRSLSRALEASSFDVEVIVVDSASTPETAAVVTQEFAHIFAAIRLLPFRENTGYTRGVNEGLRVARGRYLLALNYDIAMQRGTCEALMAYMREHPTVGLVGPRLLNLDDSVQDSCFRFYTPFIVFARRLWVPLTRRLLERFVMRDTLLAAPTAVDWVSGAAFMTTRTALDRIGLLDEKLFHYFSDVDWARRFWENGYAVVYYPQAALYHFLGRTSKGRFILTDLITNQATRWHIRDSLHYFLKHGTSGRRPEHRGPSQPTLLAA